MQQSYSFRYSRTRCAILLKPHVVQIQIINLAIYCDSVTNFIFKDVWFGYSTSPKCSPIFVNAFLFCERHFHHPRDQRIWIRFYVKNEIKCHEVVKMLQKLFSINAFEMSKNQMKMSTELEDPEI